MISNNYKSYIRINQTFFSKISCLNLKIAIYLGSSGYFFASYDYISEIRRFDLLYKNNDDKSLIVPLEETKTEKDIKAHIERVTSKMEGLIEQLRKRAENHDKSKLEYPELQGFIRMDKEPRYPYGSPEYFDKIKRYEYVFRHHYENNPHHPEHYDGWISEMDLLDIIEMLCDWTSYREGLTAIEAISTVEQQAKRFNLSDELSSIMLNTLKRYMVNYSEMDRFLGFKSADNIDMKALADFFGY